MENDRKHKGVKNYLVKEPSYYTTKFFTETLLAAEMN